MVIRTRSKTRRVSSRNLSGPYHAGLSWFYGTLTLNWPQFEKSEKSGQSWNRISGKDFGLEYKDDKNLEFDWSKNDYFSIFENAHSSKR